MKNKWFQPNPARYYAAEEATTPRRRVSPGTGQGFRQARWVSLQMWGSSRLALQCQRNCWTISTTQISTQWRQRMTANRIHPSAGGGEGHATSQNDVTVNMWHSHSTLFRHQIGTIQPLTEKEEKNLGITVVFCLTGPERFTAESRTWIERRVSCTQT